MAEARVAIDLYYLQKRGFHISGVEDGYFAVTISIPYPSTVAQTCSRFLQTAYKYMQNRLWPASIGSIVSVMSITTACTVLSKTNSSLRNSSYANSLWRLDSQYSPFAKTNVPVQIRVGYLAAATSFTVMLGVLLSERLALRILLSSRRWLYLSPKQAIPIGIKVWAGLVKFLSGNVSLLYSFGLSLPSLPLPSLKSTTAKYLASVEPLMTTAEFEKAKQEATEFRSTGKRLQLYLYFKWLFSRNYIASWWENYVYLRGRSPLCVNSNYYIMDSQFRPTNSQTKRAAYITYHFMQFAKEISDETLRPLRIKGMVPLCMEQYRRMFGTCRIPGKDTDQIKHTESKHIAVLYKGEYFRVEVFKGVRGANYELIRKEEIEKQLEHIVDTVDREETDSIMNKSVSFSNLNHINKVQSYSNFEASTAETKPKKLHRGIGIAALTAGPRSTWAETREIHFSSGQNKKSLRDIETAAMLLVLDSTPITDSFRELPKRAESLFHGNGFNRYFDKSVTLVVYKDGYLGLNCEHSWADAIPAAHLFEYGLLKELNGYFGENGEHKKQISLDKIKLTVPKRLKWETTPQLEESINQAGMFARKLISDVDLYVKEFNTYGPGFMKKQAKCSPDSYIQMALQLAYFRDRGTFDLTYESSTTRLFKDGRTETVRSLSNESVDFVKTMEKGKLIMAELDMPSSETSLEDLGSSDSADAAKTAHAKEKLALWKEEVKKKLVIATEGHSLKSKDAMAGRGIDRHLFALYITSRGMDQESSFLSSALSMPWRLSTSQQTQNQTNLREGMSPELARKFLSPGGGFGPVADDGYGVSYMTVGNERVFFHVSAKRSSGSTDSKRFTEHIFQSLKDIQALFA